MKCVDVTRTNSPISHPRELVPTSHTFPTGHGGRARALVYTTRAEYVTLLYSNIEINTFASLQSQHAFVSAYAIPG